MFRRFLITGLATTGLLAGFAAIPTAAQAHEHWYGHYHYYPPVVRVVQPCFEVYCGGPGCWDLRRTFYSRVEADRFAADLRCHGARVDIRCR
jgi:hypothetical protein